MAGRIAAFAVVFGLVAGAVYGVRHAMHERRVHAEQAFRDTLACLHTARARPRGCLATARNAAQTVLDLPEHGRRELELSAALSELATALEAGDEARLSSAVARATSQGVALNWRATPTPEAP